MIGQNTESSRFEKILDIDIRSDSSTAMKFESQQA